MKWHRFLAQLPKCTHSKSYINLMSGCPLTKKKMKIQFRSNNSSIQCLFAFWQHESNVHPFSAKKLSFFSVFSIRNLLLSFCDCWIFIGCFRCAVATAADDDVSLHHLAIVLWPVIITIDSKRTAAVHIYSSCKKVYI